MKVTNEVKELNVNEIKHLIEEDVLGVYPPEQRLIDDWKYSYNGNIVAFITPREPEYPKKRVGYATMEQMVRFISQAGYLLFGCVILDDKFTDIEKDAFDSFVQSVLEHRCYYVKVEEWAFHDKLKIEEPALIRAKLESLSYKKGRRTIAHVKFGFYSNSGDLKNEGKFIFFAEEV